MRAAEISLTRVHQIQLDKQVKHSFEEKWTRRVTGRRRCWIRMRMA